MSAAGQPGLLPQSGLCSTYKRRIRAHAHRGNTARLRTCAGLFVLFFFSFSRERTPCVLHIWIKHSRHRRSRSRGVSLQVPPTSPIVSHAFRTDEGSLLLMCCVSGVAFTAAICRQSALICNVHSAASAVGPPCSTRGACVRRSRLEAFAGASREAILHTSVATSSRVSSCCLSEVSNQSVQSDL